MIRRAFLPFLFAFAACMLLGCRGQKPDETPTQDRKDDAIYALADQVSGHVDAVVVVDNLEDFLGHLDDADAFDLLGSSAPPDAVGRIIAGSVGFDPREPRGWRSKGIRTDAPMMVAFTGDDPVLLLPLSDPELFTEYMEGRAGSYDPQPYPNRFYPRPSGANARDDAKRRGYPLWSIRDDVACIGVRGRRRDVDMNCLQGKSFEGRSLAKVDSFLAFRDGPMRNADIGFFAPGYNKATVEGLVRELSRSDDFATDVLLRGLAEVHGLSITGRVDGRTFHARGRLAVTGDGHAALSKLFDSPAVLELDGIVPPDSVAALRFGVDPETAWSWFLDVLHWELQMRLDRALVEFREEFDVELDIKKDLIEQLSGEMALVVQPMPGQVGRKGASPGQGRPSNHRYALVEDDMAFSVLVPFEDPVAPPRLLDLLRKVSQSASSRRQIVVREHQTEQGRVIKIAEFGSQYMPRIYVGEKRVMIAPTVIPIDVAEKTLAGEHPSASSAPARVAAGSGGPAAGFFDFQRLFGAVIPPDAVEKMGDLPERLEYVAGHVRMEPNALVAEAELVDTSFFRVFTSNAFDRRVRQWSRTPKDVLRESARRAVNYFSRFQGGCSRPETCKEPWHAGESSRIGDDRRVFPGGLNQRLVTSDAPPVGGRTVRYDIHARQYAQKTAALLRLEGVKSGRFQYVYETNGVAGPGASFTIKAIADLDPSSVEKHTFVLTGTVGSDGFVDVSEIEERHPYE